MFRIVLVRPEHWRGQVFLVLPLEPREQRCFNSRQNSSGRPLSVCASVQMLFKNCNLLSLRNGKIKAACTSGLKCLYSLVYFYTPDLSGRIMVWRGRLSVCLSVCPSTKLVDTIQTEPFKLGPSNLVHLLLMTRRRTLLIFKVRGQRSRSP